MTPQHSYLEETYLEEATTAKRLSHMTGEIHNTPIIRLVLLLQYILHIIYYMLQVIPVTCGVSQPVGRGVFLVGRQNVLILFKIIISCKNIFFSKYQLNESHKEEN
jgi:hypothetical protein